MSDDVWIKVEVLIHENGLVKITCEGDTVYCKVVTYAIGEAVKMAANIITILTRELESMSQKEVSKADKVNSGTM